MFYYKIAFFISTIYHKIAFSFWQFYYKIAFFKKRFESADYTFLYKIVTVHTEQCDQQHKIRIIEEENTQDNTQDGVGS